MASPQNSAADFEEIINSQRQRRKNEALALEVFGKKGPRASSTGSATSFRKPGAGPSLASRVGISKQRSSSNTRDPLLGRRKPAFTATGNSNIEWTHDLYNGKISQPSTASFSDLSKPGRLSKDTPSKQNKSTSIQGQLYGSGRSSAAPGLSIRGIAGPCVVIAENFIRGTTADDIKVAMESLGDPILKCTIVAPGTSSVNAEVVFDTRAGAEKAITTFNNQAADGLILRLYLKSNLHPINARVLDATTPSGPRLDLERNAGMKIQLPTLYNQSDSSRYIDGRRYDKGNVQDGSYGFDDRQEMDIVDDRYELNRGHNRLYSDSMVSGRRAVDSGYKVGDSRVENRDSNGRSG